MEVRAGGAAALRPTPSPADGAVIAGYAAVFNSQSADLGGFVEIIEPGAFDRSLADRDDVLCTRDHDPRQMLGRTSSGTLRLSKDANGLRFEVDTPTGVTYADDLVLLMDPGRGDIAGASFKFQCRDDLWALTPDGQVLRSLRDVSLRDVSVVPTGAYPSASSALVAGSTPTLSLVGGRSSGGGDLAAARAAFENRKAQANRPAVQAALDQMIGQTGTCSIESLDADLVVYTQQGGVSGTYQAAYAVQADGTVTLGSPVLVVRRSKPEPVDTAPPPASVQANRLAVQTAIGELLAGNGGTFWVEALDADWAVYTQSGAVSGTYQVPYTVDADGTVALGSPVAVGQAVAFVPAGGRCAPVDTSAVDAKLRALRESRDSNGVRRPSLDDARLAMLRKSRHYLPSSPV